MGEIIIGNHGVMVHEEERKCPKEWGTIRINKVKFGSDNSRFLSEQAMAQLRERKIPTDLIFFYNGLQRNVADQVPYEKPPWYDDDKFKLGQQFAHDYYGSVNYAEMLTLLVLFSFQALGPLIYTRRSDTTLKAAKRYLSTALRVLSWYEDDIWDKNSAAYKNIQIVKAYHKNTVKRMVKHSKQELEHKSKLRHLLPDSEIKCQSLPALEEDFKGACPFWLEESVMSGVLVNQAEMSFTLFGFMGLIILYPDKLGIHGASQEQLGGFVHLWRVLGYLLGIEDEFNMCQGSFEEVKTRCQQIVDMVFIPNLCNLSEEWEHMSRCMIEGVALTIRGPTFETSMLQLFWMVGVQPKNYRKNLKWKYIVKHCINRFIMSCILRFSCIRLRFNTWVKSQMRLKAVTLLNESENLRDCNENQ